MNNPLSNKEALALLRIGLEEEDLSVPVLAEPLFIADTGQVVASINDEARESICGGIEPNSRRAQFISLTDRALFLLATLPTTGTN